MVNTNGSTEGISVEKVAGDRNGHNFTMKFQWAL
jgi:hypothetical protein